MTLVAEVFALPLLLWRPTRAWLATALLGFHLGQWAVFGYSFYGNLIAVAAFGLPVERGLAALVGRLEAPPDRRWRRWARALAGRLRVFEPPAEPPDTNQ